MNTVLCWIAAIVGLAPVAIFLYALFLSFRVRWIYRAEFFALKIKQKDERSKFAKSKVEAYFDDERR